MLFLQMLVVAFHTFLWSSYQISGTWLHCRSTHSWLSQAATRSSGMWRQEMLPSILHGCHLDTISNFSKFCPGYFWSDLVYFHIRILTAVIHMNHTNINYQDYSMNRNHIFWTHMSLNLYSSTTASIWSMPCYYIYTVLLTANPCPKKKGMI
jgi:hypothetical protein